MQLFAPPVRDRKVRFALVGCVRIANSHFDSIAKLSEHCELVDVCDTNPIALAEAVAKTGAKGYADLGEMLAKSEADCVVLTTPSSLHPRQAIAAARAGLTS